LYFLTLCCFDVKEIKACCVKQENEPTKAEIQNIINKRKEEMKTLHPAQENISKQDDNNPEQQVHLHVYEEGYQAVAPRQVIDTGGTSESHQMNTGGAPESHLMNTGGAPESHQMNTRGASESHLMNIGGAPESQQMNHHVSVIQPNHTLHLVL
jgi:hypothetical protein